MQLNVLERWQDKNHNVDNDEFNDNDDDDDNDDAYNKKT